MMDDITVIHGTYTNSHFIPDEPPPQIEGRAELIVFPESQRTSGVPKAPQNRLSVSIFDVLGKAAVLRSGEDIDAQLEMERRAWDED